MISTFKLLTNRSFWFQLFWIYQVTSYNPTLEFPELQILSYIVGVISWLSDSHDMFLEWWNTIKSLSTIWQRFFMCTW